MDSFDVLQEFINDIKRAYPADYNDSEVDEKELDWPDLMVTYRHAKMVLAKHQEGE